MTIFKKISTRFTIYNILCIILLTALFIPFFLIFQKSLFTQYEKNRMITFADAFVPWYQKSRRTEEEIREYIEDNHAQDYNIKLYDETADYRYVFHKRLLPKENSSVEAGTKSDPEDREISGKNFRAERYSQDALPGTKGRRKNITLRKLYILKGNNYYLYCRESMNTLDSMFSYTNRMMLVLLAVYAVFCSIILYLISKHMTKPIIELSKVTEQLSLQDYSIRYSGKPREDEIGILTKNVNQMANTIQENITSLQNWNYLLHDRIDILKEYAEEHRRVMAIITHELKTPLSVISSQIEMMNLVEDVEKKEMYYQYCMDELDKMSHMISRILNESASTRKLFQSSPEETDISQKIEELCEGSRRFVETHDLTLSTDIQKNCIKYLYREHIEFVFNNYLMNAVRHSPKGGEIQVKLHESGKAVRLSVINEGSQVADEDKDRIWIGFFSTDLQDNDSDIQEDQKEDREANYGLGLFIVKEIAAVECSRCGFINHPEGVEFWFDFINVSHPLDIETDEKHLRC